MCYIRIVMRNEHTIAGFQFREFTRLPWKTVDNIRVSIYVRNRRAQIYLNKKCTESLGHPQMAILFFDNDKQVIGVKPTVNPVPHAIMLRKHQQREFRMTITEFLVENEVVLNYSIRFTDPYIDAGMLILDLNRTTRVQGRTG